MTIIYPRNTPVEFRVWKVNGERWMFPLRLVNPVLESAMRKFADCTEGIFALDEKEYEQLQKMENHCEFRTIK